MRHYLALVAFVCLSAFGASSDVTLGGSAGGTIYVDNTQHTATLKNPGGVVLNAGGQLAFINVVAGTVITTGATAVNNYGIPGGCQVVLPSGCKSFTFATAASNTTLTYFPTPINQGTITAVPAAALPVMIGDSGAGGVKGAAPAPAAGDAAANKFLKADGTWTALSIAPTFDQIGSGTNTTATMIAGIGSTFTLNTGSTNVARTDIGQTFTGSQEFAGLVDIEAGNNIVNIPADDQVGWKINSHGATQTADLFEAYVNGGLTFNIDAFGGISVGDQSGAIGTSGYVQFYPVHGNNFIIQAPNTTVGNPSLILPAANPSANNAALIATTSGVSSWSSAAVAAVPFGGGINVTGGTITVPAGSITGLALTDTTVLESKFNFSNVATANVTTAQHGLAPRAPNDANQFLNGLATYSTVPGSFIRTTTINTSGSSTFTVTASTTLIRIRVQGAGGGGGGAASAAVTSGAGGGGSAGGYAEKKFTVTPSTAYSYTVGAGGAGGVAGNNTGTAGGNSTFTVGGTTITAFGGLGGIGSAATIGVINLGGASPAISTNGDTNAGGMPGGYGLTSSATVAGSGHGGSCSFGGGGNTVNTDAAGSSGVGNGAGGSGGCVINGGTAQAGGAGQDGIIVIDEYR